MTHTEVELGPMRHALALIAEKGWVEPPALAQYPLLIERASYALDRAYTVAHLRQLYRSMEHCADLPQFEDMTAECFLDAMRPIIATTKREVA